MRWLISQRAPYAPQRGGRGQSRTWYACSRRTKAALSGLPPDSGQASGCSTRALCRAKGEDAECCRRQHERWRRRHTDAAKGTLELFSRRRPADTQHVVQISIEQMLGRPCRGAKSSAWAAGGGSQGGAPQPRTNPGHHRPHQEAAIECAEGRGEAGARVQQGAARHSEHYPASSPFPPAIAGSASAQQQPGSRARGSGADRRIKGAPQTQRSPTRGCQAPRGAYIRAATRAAVAHARPGGTPPGGGPPPDRLPSRARSASLLPMCIPAGLQCQEDPHQHEPIPAVLQL